MDTTDFQIYRKKLKQVWDRFAETGEVTPGIIREEITESWKRCRAHNLDPRTDRITATSDTDERERIFRTNHDLLMVARPFLKGLYDIIRSLEFVVFLTDRDGFILEAMGEGVIWDYCQYSNAAVGSSFNERYSGTTAPGLALIHDKPYQMIAEEHYLSAIHVATCAAAPIHNEAGKVIGSLDLTASFEAAQKHPHTLGMIVAAARVIEDQLKLQREWERSFLANQYLEATMQSMETGIIAMNRDAAITHINPKMGRILGISASSYVGQTIDSIIKNPILLNAISQNEELAEQEIQFHESVKQARYITSYRPITSPTGKQLGSVILVRELKRVRELVRKLAGFQARYTFDDLKGDSEQIQQTIHMARSLSNSPSNLIISGESGTGKEMLAQSMHNSGPNADGPFVAINSTAIPRDLIESELFGYEAGTFTGAAKGGRPGKFELAFGGTLFLDEINGMSLDMQAKLLRCIEEKRFQRLGGKSYLPLNARIIAATNHDLFEETEQRNFRSDLYYRLNVLEIHVPPLRDRQGDVAVLTHLFISEISRKLGKSVAGISQEALALLEAESWPGNVRQLKNWVERAVNLTLNTELKPEDFPLEYKKGEKPIQEHSRNQVTNRLSSAERETIQQALLSCDGNLSRAAKDLGIGRSTLYRKLKKYSLSVKKGFTL